MAYTFLKSRGLEVGRSLVEEDKLTLAAALIQEAAAHGVELLLPIDHIAGDADRKNPAVCDEQIPHHRMGLDIGPNTARRFTEEIKKAKMVLWNGPVGLFEVPPYDQGGRALAQTLADHFPEITSIIAGGDTVAAINAAGVQARITHLSTGGGATLEFLEGKELPGLKALQEAS
jgi:phosphoglycerate kinase